MSRRRHLRRAGALRLDRERGVDVVMGNHMAQLLCVGNESVRYIGRHRLASLVVGDVPLGYANPEAHRCLGHAEALPDV